MDDLDFLDIDHKMVTTSLPRHFFSIATSL